MWITFDRKAIRACRTSFGFCPQKLRFPAKFRGLLVTSAQAAVRLIVT
jgi:hypothetical protein